MFVNRGFTVSLCMTLDWLFKRNSVLFFVYLVLINKEPKNPKKKIEVPKEKVCLIRATFKNKKLSTRVS